MEIDTTAAEVIETGTAEEAEDEIVFDLSDMGIEPETGADAPESAEEKPEETQDEPEEKTDGEDAPESAEGKPEEAETKPTAEIEVKYNGVIKKLTAEEAAQYAQKGLNYDKLKERLDGYEAEHGVLAQLAEAAGKPVAEMLTELTQRLEQAEVDKREQELISEGVPKEKAAQLAKKLYEKEKSVKTDTDKVKQLEEENLQHRAREAALSKWQSFTRDHPEITEYEALPAEVREAIKAGKDLDDAYNAYEVKLLREEKARLAQAAENKKKAPPASKNAGGPAEDENDKFLKGFLENY